MKLRNRFLKYTFFILILLCIFFWINISHLTKTYTCQQSNVIRATGERFYTHPQKVVIEPWRGEHHVYAIFMLPGGYLNDYLFTLTVEGIGSFCGELDFAGTTVADGVYAQPGHYLMRALLSTRAALLLIISGRGNELQRLDNWNLGYSKIESPSP